MRLRTGSSGFSYASWKGAFYPEKLPARGMLAYYAARLATVELNNTFYRMPTRSAVEGWAAAVPGDFRFAVKASRRITHGAKLSDEGESLAYLWNALEPFGEKLGPVLFQLPPQRKADLEVLRDFLAQLPDGLDAAFEFRHASWKSAAVLDALAERGAALCVSDADPSAQVELERTAAHGYLRLRRPEYDDAALGAWAERLRDSGWDEAYVFFKHEESGKAARYALELAARFGGAGGPQTATP